MTRPNRSLLSFALIATAATRAHAQPAPAPPPSPAPAPAATDADQAYQRGRSHYDLHEWDQAIAEFKEAYRLRPDAPALFNIAQSYRLKGDCAQAASFYKTYRRNFPNEKNIARVDQFITEMEACAKQAPPTGTTTTPTDTSTTGTGTGTTTETGGTGAAGGTTAGEPLPAQPTPVVDSPAPHMPRGYLIGSIAAAGVGVGCIIGGALSASRARSIETDIEVLPVWDPDLHERGQRADLAAKILFVSGGAALITSGVLLFVGMSKTEARSAPATTLHVVPHAGGASVVFSGSL
jgi:tetratricopeptide (TPR) repeat protein